MATVLDLVRATAVRLQLPYVKNAIGNQDAHVGQILAAMSASADDLLSRYPLNRKHLGGLWLRGADGVSLRAPKLDTDVVLIDEPLFKASTLWRWRSDNGFDYAEDLRAAEERLSRLALDYTRANRGRMVLS